MASSKELINKAKNAMEHSYAPYSRFQVGAALETEDGYVYTGCNIENASFGATNCAERTAVFKAVSEGHVRINKIAIVSSSQKKTPPCGICLQVLSEFVTKNAMIILEDDDQIMEYPFTDYLPGAFSLSDYDIK